MNRNRPSSNTGMPIRLALALRIWPHIVTLGTVLVIAGVNWQKYQTLNQTVENNLNRLTLIEHDRDPEKLYSLVQSQGKQIDLLSMAIKNIADSQTHDHDNIVRLMALTESSLKQRELP